MNNSKAIQAAYDAEIELTDDDLFIYEYSEAAALILVHDPFQTHTPATPEELKALGEP